MKKALQIKCQYPASGKEISKFMGLLQPIKLNLAIKLLEHVHNANQHDSVVIPSRHGHHHCHGCHVHHCRRDNDNDP
jgi:hypothetical protein